MKKIAATLMALALALSLAACGDDAGTTSSESSTEAPVSSTPSESGTPADDSSVPDIPPVEEEESLNLALKGTPIADSVNEGAGYGDGLSALADGNKLTRWQAASKAEVPENATEEEEEAARETEEHPSWFGIEWDEAQTFDTLYVLWENAHPEEDGFRVEISQDGENWEAVEFTSVRGGNMIEEIGVLDPDKQHDTITLSEAVTAKAVRVVCFTYYTVPDLDYFDGDDGRRGNPKSPTSVYEFEIYNSADVEAAESEDAETEDGETEEADEEAAEEE